MYRKKHKYILVFLTEKSNKLWWLIHTRVFLNDESRSPRMLQDIGSAGQRICLAPSSMATAERNQCSQIGCKFTCKSSEQSDLHQLDWGICTLCSSIKRIRLIAGTENNHNPFWCSLRSTPKWSPGYETFTLIQLRWLNLLQNPYIELEVTVLEVKNVL